MHTSLEGAGAPPIIGREEVLDYGGPQTPRSSRVSRRWDWRRIVARVAIVAVMLDVALFAAVSGLRVRKWAFIATDGVHFKGDVRNAFRWGTEADRVGILNLYDEMAPELVAAVEGGQPRKTLDYPPMRLVVAWQWVRWAHRNYPGINAWQDDYDFTRPMLNGNTVAEAMASVLVFLLIRLWVRRQDAAGRPVGWRQWWLRGSIAGLCGALLMWFNPAVIWISHCWPQWDVWLIPFFLAGVFLASVDWWFAAGFVLMIGASFKGQILIGAPVLLLWPLFTLRLGAVFRLLAGLSIGAAVVALPWLKMCAPATDDAAAVWKAGAIAWCAGMAIVGAAGVVAALFLSKFARRHWDLVTAAWALVVAAAVFATIPMFHTDTAWYTVGFKHGTEKFGNMIVGSGIWNVAKMQQEYRFFGTSYSDPTDPVTTLPSWTARFSSDGAPAVLTYRGATLIVYCICLVACGIGAAIHGRRRRPDARFLVAVITPWLCMVMVMTQMHGRYPMYAAGLWALLAGVSVGMSLLGVLLSVIATLGVMENQYLYVPNYDPDMLQFLRTLDPHVGWMLLLIMFIWLYYSVAPKRSSS